MARWLCGLSFGLGLTFGLLSTPGCGEACEACSTPPYCEDVDGDAPCGCSCNSPSSWCELDGDVHYIANCNFNGACVERTACAEGLVCMPDSDIAVCVEPSP